MGKTCVKAVRHNALERNAGIIFPAMKRVRVDEAAVGTSRKLCMTKLKPTMLLIALRGYYDCDIKAAFEDLGLEVDMVNERPRDSVAFKAAVRLNLNVYGGTMRRYYHSLLEQRRGKDYDYVVVIRGEYFTEESIAEYRSEFKSAQFILYLWDSAANYPAVKQRWGLYDRVLSFDRRDVEENPGALRFRPLFFVDAFDRRRMQRGSSKPQYTAVFVGTAHSDRPQVVNCVKQQIEESGGSFYSYWYQPTSVLFYYNRLKGDGFAGLKSSEVHHQFLPRDEVAGILSSARATVDAEHPKQVGLTMRTIESVGLGIKLITTNADVKNYDFYNAENICVIDRDDPKVDIEFIESPPVPPTTQVLDKYSIRGWAKDVLGAAGGADR